MSRKSLNIEVIAPCSPYTPEKLNKGIECLKAYGHRVQIPLPPPQWKHGYLNGNTSFRIEAIKNALLNQNNDVVWIARGGYGLTPLLPYLKEELSSLKGCPKVIGFSDVTALHCFLLSQKNITSFHGPLATTLANETQDNIESILEWLCGETNETSYVNLVPRLKHNFNATYLGRLWGGNLTVLGNLAGTGFLPDLPGILFLEDVGERPYRIDRTLHQLEQARAFKQVQAVILGHFTGCEEPDTGQKVMGPVPTAKEVLASHFERLQIPVFDGLPCGHQSPNHVLPVGAYASIQATSDQATLYMTLQSAEG